MEVGRSIGVMPNFAFCILNVEDVVSLDLIEGQIEHADNVFKVIPGQVAAAYYRVQPGKAFANVEAMHGRRLHVTDTQKFFLVHAL